MPSSYSEKLRDPRWQRRRLEVMQRDDFRCQGCGDRESTLHVHHKAYAQGEEPWETPLALLVTLCECCHEDDSAWHASTLRSLYVCLDAIGLRSNLDISWLTAWVEVKLKEATADSEDARAAIIADVISRLPAVRRECGDDWYHG